MKPSLRVAIASVIAFSLVGLGAFFTQGCKTVATSVVKDGVTNIVTTSELDPVRTSEAIRTIVSVAVPFAVEKDTNSIAYLRAASIVLRVAADKGQFDPTQLQATLATISVKELRTPEARTCINAALGIYRAYFAEASDQKLEQVTWVKPVLLALANGIADGLPPLN